MLDRTLRPAKDALLEPVVAHVPAPVTPVSLTVAAALVGIGAAVAAAVGMFWLAVVLWLVSRVLDGLDGAVARRRGATSDLGGYLDMLLDVVVYAAVPIGIAVGVGGVAVWIACAVALATFYVNVLSWSYLSALLERRGRGAESRGELTRVTMPRGLVEGAETLVLFTVALAVPQWAAVVLWVMAAGVAVSAVQRAVWATRVLGEAA